MLRNCPDCGERPDIKENHMVVGGFLFSGVKCDECQLVAMHFTTQKGIDLWNEMCDEWTKHGGPEEME